MPSTIDMLKVLIIFGCLSFGSTESGQITTWSNDAVNEHCRKDSTEWCKSNYCSAPMVAATCPTKRGRDTAEGNKFKQLCKHGEDGNRHIDGKYITDADMNACLTCGIRVCDLPNYPAVDFECYKPICVTANSRTVETHQIDVCPSNHQKNVAKCCMWGGAWCSCVISPTLDLSFNAYKELGSVQSGTWTIDFIIVLKIYYQNAPPTIDMLKVLIIFGCLSFGSTGKLKFADKPENLHK
uniref:Uncharacterized protein n=1 Tax=Panagrolaimus sp. ES5 TaxID=591445 RepID=A0AC34FES2_9BILA